MKKKKLNMKPKKLTNKLPINIPINALIEPIIKEKKNKERFYVNPDRLDELIKEYYKTNILTDELAEMVAKITHNLSFAPNFVNYTYKEEMIGDAIIKCINALKNKNVDPDKGSSFWYFSMIAYNAFRNRIKKEKQNHATMRAYQSEIYDRMIEKGLIPTDSNEHDSDQDGDYDA